MDEVIKKWDILWCGLVVEIERKMRLSVVCLVIDTLELAKLIAQRFINVDNQLLRVCNGKKNQTIDHSSVVKWSVVELWKVIEQPLILLNSSRNNIEVVQSETIYFISFYKCGQIGVTFHTAPSNGVNWLIYWATVGKSQVFFSFTFAPFGLTWLECQFALCECS